MYQLLAKAALIVFLLFHLNVTKTTSLSCHQILENDWMNRSQMF